MPASKWIDDVACDMSVYEAAGRSLQSALAMVVHYFPMAIEDTGENTEHIHQLRVSTRRAITALKLYADVLPARQVKWFRRRLSKVRREAGKARDLDVLARNYANAKDRDGKRLQKRIRRERRGTRPPIEKLYNQLMRDGSLAEHVSSLLDGIKENASDTTTACFEDWARSRLRQVVKKFFKAAPVIRYDLASLHRFRIHGKELRYTMELLAPAFPDEFREGLYPVVQALQTKLGNINDHSVACQRFEKWLVSSKRKKQRRYLLKRLKRERQQLELSLRAFDQWWTPEFANEIRAAFQQFVNSRPLTSSTPLESS